MSKKNNIEELFKDSMDDFRVDPPKETSRKILLGLFWSNVFYKFKGSIAVAISAAAAGIGLLVFNQMGDDNISGDKNLTQNELSNKIEMVQLNDTAEEKAFVGSSENATNEVTHKSSPSVSKEQQNSSNNVALSTSHSAELEGSTSQNSNKAATSETGKADDALNSAINKKVKETKSNKSKIKSTNKNKEGNKSKVNKGGNNQVSSDTPNESKLLRQQENPGDIDFDMANGNQATQDMIEKFNQGGDDVKQAQIADSTVINQGDILARSTEKIDSLTADSTKKAVDPEKKKLPVTFFVSAGFNMLQPILSNESNYRYSPSYLGEISAGGQYKNVLFSSGLGYEQYSLTLERRDYIQVDSELVMVPYTYKDTLTKMDTTVYIEKNQAVLKNVKALDGRTIDLQYLSVPIQFAYQRSFQKHVVMLRGGLGMRFLISYSQTETPTDTNAITTVGMPLFEPKKFMLNYNVQLNYGYQFTPRLLLLGGVSFSQYISDEMKVGLGNIDPPYHTKALGGSLQILYKF